MREYVVALESMAEYDHIHFSGITSTRIRKHMHTNSLYRQLALFVLVSACSTSALFSVGIGYAMELNDTGLVKCYNNTNEIWTVTPDTPWPIFSSFLDQDCADGLSALDARGQMIKLGGSIVAGRDYTKIAKDGSELPEGAMRGDGPHQWACTRDNVTGLLWEVKSDDSQHLRYYGHRYSWYEPAIANNGTSGSPSGYQCNQTLEEGGTSACNTQAYRDRINAESLCGHSDWRLPRTDELQSLVDYSMGSGINGQESECNNQVSGAIDRKWFSCETQKANIGHGKA